MAKDSPLNIFYAAAKSKKTVASSGSAQAMPVAPTRNLTIDAMLEKMNDMRKEIDDKLEAMMTTSGVSKEVLSQYLNNKQNFTTEQWDFLQQKNEEFSQKIWTTLGPTISVPPSTGSKGSESSSKTRSATESPPSMQPLSNGPASSTASPSRKSKFSGSRRNWIPTG